MKTASERVADWRLRNPGARHQWDKPKKPRKSSGLTKAELLARWKLNNPEKHQANYNRARDKKKKMDEEAREKRLSEARDRYKAVTDLKVKLRKNRVNELIEDAKKNKDKIRKALKLK